MINTALTMLARKSVTMNKQLSMNNNHTYYVNRLNLDCRGSHELTKPGQRTLICQKWYVLCKSSLGKLWTSSTNFAGRATCITLPKGLFINDVIILGGYPRFSLQTNHVLRVYNVLSIHWWSEVKPAKNEDVIYKQTPTVDHFMILFELKLRFSWWKWPAHDIICG